MNRKQAERYHWLRNAVASHGITTAELDTLLRCSRTLSRWSERECNGEIQRDEYDMTPYIYNTTTGKRMYRTADREKGALDRAAAIAIAHNFTLYHQTDPRGCALYLIRPGDVPQGMTVDCCYSNGIAVCID